MTPIQIAMEIVRRESQYAVSRKAVSGRGVGSVADGSAGLEVGRDRVLCPDVEVEAEPLAHPEPKLTAPGPTAHIGRCVRTVPLPTPAPEPSEPAPAPPVKTGEGRSPQPQPTRFPAYLVTGIVRPDIDDENRRMACVEGKREAQLLQWA